MKSNGVNGGGSRWGTREKILMYFGLALISAAFINSEVLGRTFHAEFLLGGLALCGISIAQWGDRK